MPAAAVNRGDPLNIELLYFPDCPLVPRVREALRRSLERLELPWRVDERTTSGPSPTLRINGVDVMGDPPTTAMSCRLDLPTEQLITACIAAAQR